MRRKDRLVTDKKEILNILENNDVCRVAIKDKEGLYIVPLNYGFEFINDKLTLYFHGAKEGRKAAAFKDENKEVAFEIDEKIKMEGDGNIACTYTYYYKSIVGNGFASIVGIDEERKRALRLIMFNITKRDDFKYDNHSLSNTLIMKVEATVFTVKIHK